jgi:serine protease Do
VTLGKLTETSVPAERPVSKTPGLRVRDFTPALARQFGVPYEAGVMVESVVQNSPAAQVGLQRYDVIVEVNRAPVTEATVFQRFIEETKAPLLLLVKRRTVLHYLLLPLG